MAAEIRTPLSFDVQSIIDALPDPTLVLNALEQVEFVNRPAERLFAYSAAEWRGNKINFLLSSRSDENFSWPAAHSPPLEALARVKNGGTLRVQISRRGVSQEDSQPAYSVVSMRVLDHLNNLHPCMVQVTRLAMLGAMAAGISHELNQPLSAIANYAQAAKWLMESPTHDRAEIVDSLNEITTQAVRAAGIIRRLRALIQKGEVTETAKREPSTIDEVLAEIKDFVAAEARLKSVRLIFDLAPSLPPVTIDRIQMQQVVLSLIRNAIEALGNVPREEREVQVLARLLETGDVEVTVEDTGPGVAPEIEARLFHPYSTTREGGAGLGLATSKMIVEAHQGALVYRPNEPRGARFSFRLPISKGK